MRIRPMEPSDAHEIARIHAECWIATYVGRVPEHVAVERVERARQRDWLDQSRMRVDTGGGVFVASTLTALVGFCEFGPTEDPDEDPSTVGHIMRLYVDPPLQHGGAGRALLEKACEHMGDGGYRSVTLWTPEPSWNAARGFYEHLGWLPEEARNGDDPPDMRYRLLLA